MMSTLIDLLHVPPHAYLRISVYTLKDKGLETCASEGKVFFLRTFILI